jgi:hypothetical protein
VLLRRIGGILVILSAVVLLLSSVKVSRTRKVAEIGFLNIQVHEDSRPLVPSWVAGVVFVAGIGVLVIGRRGARSTA